MKNLVKFWVEKRGFSLATQSTEQGTSGLVLAFQNAQYLCAVVLKEQTLVFVTTDSSQGTTTERELPLATASADGILTALREACFKRSLDADTVLGRQGQEWADMYGQLYADAHGDASLAEHLTHTPAYSFGLLFA